MSFDNLLESLGRPVSIDWMMKSADAGLTTGSIDSMATYLAGKTIWGTISTLAGRANHPFQNLTNPANLNSPTALAYWYNNADVTLENMFSPAIKQCQCDSK